ncbi:MAG TPA: ribosome small subunit-dependent GTPase A [Candidatus Dormibacteraeota bacterium]|nr:ribosome small subunit-dependent GTPase A [Candidatus Dormibacteraeota bacterium]
MPLQDEPRLHSLGWDPWFESRFAAFAAEGVAPARVCADYGAEYEVRDGTAAMRAVAAARLRESGMQPAVGDWVALTYRPGTPLISGVLERRTTFSRKTASVETKQQVLAANVDVALVVASAQDVNARRIERYLTMAWQSGAAPVVVLTKADLAESADALRVELETAAAGSPVVVTSSVSGEGVDEVAAQLRPSRTGVLLGPSGAGKSSLINRLLGREAMKTRAVHATGEGRHMTSHRELFELPGGGVIIDTPGLREAQLWSGEDALGNLFDDVEDLARQCRFADCRHETEPGCAVKEAIVEGVLDAARLASYRKLQRELRAVAAKSDARLRADERRKWKQITVANRVRERYLR